MARPSRFDHDDCLRACFNHKDKLTEDELWLLSKVAGNWAAQLSVSRDELDRARAIVARVEA